MSRDRRAIREKIETEAKFCKWFRGYRDAEYLSEDLTPGATTITDRLNKTTTITPNSAGQPQHVDGVRYASP